MFVIAGVSGNTGSVVANQLLAAGRKVRVVVRDAAKGEPWAAKGAEVAVADLGDADALAAALAGAEGAWLLLPPNVGAADVPAYQEQLTDAIVTAVGRARPGHVVFLSSVGAHLPSGTGPILALHNAEPRLAAVAPDITFVRPGFFMENWGGSLGALAQGIFPSFYDLDRPIDHVATADIGRVAAEALLAGPKGHRVIELAGPVAQTPVEVGAVVSALVGKAIPVVPAPIEALVPTFVSFGLSASMAGLYEEMTRAMNAGKLVFEGAPVRGIVPVDQVLGRLLGR
ncbi:MAG: NAD(P)H-binding protein [Pseudomonadota bacterium]|nr:NAD(P)H-binding protein [Pseudomonadota bacterium]